MKALDGMLAAKGVDDCTVGEHVREAIIAANTAVVEVYEPIRKQLEAMDGVLERVHADCSKVLDQVDRVSHQTEELMHTTQALQRETDATKTRLGLSEAFVSTFWVQDMFHDEVNDAFFSYITRLEQAKTNCATMLEQESVQERVCLELMEDIGSRLHECFLRLSHFVSITLQNDDASDKVMQDVAEAMSILHRNQRFGYYHQCTVEYSEFRRRHLAHAFLTALTTATALSDPIDAHAYDPYRFASDMLAWIHQHLVLERTTVTQILPDESVQSHIRNISEAVTQPLLTRLQQCIQNAETTDVYRVHDLCDYYSQQFAGMMAEGAALLSTLEQCRDEALSALFQSMERYLSLLKEDCPLPDANLRVPEELHDCLLWMKSLSSAIERSLGAAMHTTPLLTAMVDPVLALVTEGSDVLQLSPAQALVYRINMVCELHMLLRSFSFAAGKVEVLLLLLENDQKDLVDCLANQVLKQFQVDGYLDPDAAIDTAVFQRRMQAFCSALVHIQGHAASSLIPVLALIQRQQLRLDTLRSFLFQLASRYATLHATAKSLSVQLPYSPDQFTTLLDV